MVDLIDELNALEQRLSLLLKDELGKFSNGEPAIWKGLIIPVELKTNGLQCTIQPVKEGEVIMLSAGQRFENQYWVVELVNFCVDLSSTDYLKLAIAKRKLEQAFTLARTPIYQAPNDLRLERCVFHLYAPLVANP
jgi:hypothetical protein